MVNMEAEIQGPNERNEVNEIDVCELEHLRKLFIGGLSPNTNEENLRKFYERWGQIDDVVVNRDPKTNRSRGFGFVTYTKSSSLDVAQSNRPHTIDGKTVQSKRALLRSDLENPDANVTVNKIFIGGLKDNQDEQCLRDYFSRFGSITSIKILTDKATGKRRGFAYLEFDDYDAVDKVILHKPHHVKEMLVDVKKSVYQGQTVRPQNNMSNNSLNFIFRNMEGTDVNPMGYKLFIGGLKNEHDESCLREYFSQFGSVVSINILTDKSTGKRRGFAFVELNSLEAADKAISHKPHIIKNIMVDVKKSSYEQEIKNRQQNTAMNHMNTYLNTPYNPDSNTSAHKVFVGGLKNLHDENCLREYFSNFGNVISVKILVDKATGKRRGFAYVGFSQSEAMERALFQEKHFIKQIMVEVKRSHYKQDQKNIEPQLMEVFNSNGCGYRIPPANQAYANNPHQFINNIPCPSSTSSSVFFRPPTFPQQANRSQNFGFGYQQGFAGGPIKHNNAPNPFRMNPYGSDVQVAPVGLKLRR